MSLNALSELDPKNFQILMQVPLRRSRAHGIDLANDAVWRMFARERVVHKLDPGGGKVREIIQLMENDPDPHGMCIHDGYMCNPDAGLTATIKGSFRALCADSKSREFLRIR